MAIVTEIVSVALVNNVVLIVTSLVMAWLEASYIQTFKGMRVPATTDELAATAPVPVA